MNMSKYDLTAIITDKRGRIISIGKNSYIKTHPMQARLAKQMGEKDRIYLHAEIHAIVKCRDLSRAHKITVIRIDKQGNYRMAKPCKICAEAIRNSGINLIEYT